jgi:hypothetical protein
MSSVSPNTFNSRVLPSPCDELVLEQPILWAALQAPPTETEFDGP